MPQHQRTGVAWTARRLGRRAQVSWDGRPPHARRTGAPDPQVTQRPTTTLDATLQPELGQGYRHLRWGPGEPHLVREDLGVPAGSDRTAARRSLLYFAHHTDVHICDAQSPARLEAGERLAWMNPGTDSGHRPQEHSTVQVFDQMIRATNAVRQSPVTGAEMAFCIQTGDNTDNRQLCETRWFVDTLDGKVVTPNTGHPDRYEGVQSQSHLRWTYHPDDPSRDFYGRIGFPRLPGLLASAIRPVDTAGIDVPWLAVMGNHDGIWQGTFGRLSRLRLDLVESGLTAGGRKPVSLLGYLSAAAVASTRGADGMTGWTGRDAGPRPGRHTVGSTADPEARRGLGISEYLAEMFRTDPVPGPVGHGFTEDNLRDGTTWWSRPQGERFQLIGLDTTNHTAGSEGRLGPGQLAWLEAELTALSSDHGGSDRLVIVFSHHNSATMTNTVEDATDPGPAIGGEALLELFARFPNVVLWVNGHSHVNEILAHPRPGGDGDGLWEINTASCIDFGQQTRTIEVLDNGDGTLSVLTTSLDHAAPVSTPARADKRYTSAQLASLSRELASNDARWIDPWEQRGGPEDRNAELVLRRPDWMG